MKRQMLAVSAILLAIALAIVLIGLAVKFAARHHLIPPVFGPENPAPACPPFCPQKQ